MFDDIGTKIKNYAVASFWVEAISAVIAGFILLINSENAIWLILIIGGPLSALAPAWFLYALGEIAESAGSVSYHSMEISRQLDTLSRTVAQLEENARCSKDTKEQPTQYSAKSTAANTNKTIKDNTPHKDPSTMQKPAESDSQPDKVNAEIAKADIKTLDDVTAEDFVINSNALEEYLGNEKYVSIPGDITTIEKNSFREKTQLLSVIVPQGVKSIENWAFNKSTNLKEIYIPGSVNKIGLYAFYGCNLTIYAPAGSYAEEYAKSHNIPFIAK